MVDGQLRAGHRHVQRGRDHPVTPIDTGAQVYLAGFGAQYLDRVNFQLVVIAGHQHRVILAQDVTGQNDDIIRTHTPDFGIDKGADTQSLLLSLAQHSIGVDHLGNGVNHPAGFIDHPLGADDLRLPVVGLICVLSTQGDGPGFDLLVFRFNFRRQAEV